ncbi:MAG: glucose-6-phosphate isomerase [Pseudomonadota bacterium]
MRRHLIKPTLFALPLVLAGCLSSTEQQQLGGAAIGAGSGFIAGMLLGFGSGWVAVTTLAGAAAGTLIATNNARKECAYADGSGGYVTRSC